MSQPSNKPTPSGIAEAQAFAFIKFYREQPDGTIVLDGDPVHSADCLISARVAGHKEDLEPYLGPIRKQIWCYNNQLIADDKKLSDYEIDGSEEVVIILKRN